MTVSIPTEQAALLSAIVAHPDDDTARHVYADWLQENGDEEQATFIRDSVKLEWVKENDHDTRERIEQRIDDVFTRNASRWLGKLGITGINVTYERGMIRGLEYDFLDQFLANAPTLFARVPVRAVTINAVDVREHRDGFAVLADMPELLRLRELHLDNRGLPASSEGWERFITSPHLANLRELTAQNAALTDEDMLAFDRCKCRRLRELSLVGNRLTAVGALTVVRSPHLPNLTRLKSWGNEIVEDRSPGSVYLALQAALSERFD
jgi:uncharacterized protein (TIGR02996 family)